MFKLWMCLSVLYVLLCRVSGDQAVSLACPNVTVRRGDRVELNCSIIWKDKFCDREHPCYILNNGSEIRSWPCYNETHVSLKIMDKVMKEESVTVTLQTDCGMDGSTIEVQVTEIPTEQIPTEQIPTQSSVKDNPEAKPHMSYIVVGVFVVTVLGMLAFLFKTNRMTKINKHFRDVFKGYSSRQQPLTSEDHRPSII